MGFVQHTANRTSSPGAGIFMKVLYFSCLFNRLPALLIGCRGRAVCACAGSPPAGSSEASSSRVCGAAGGCISLH